jgi:excisionase family DNA binding protein
MLGGHAVRTDVGSGGEFIKVAEAARRLDLTPETVRKHIRSGAIPGIYLGPQLRVDWGALHTQLTSSGGLDLKPPRARKGH